MFKTEKVTVGRVNVYKRSTGIFGKPLTYTTHYTGAVSSQFDAIKELIHDTSSVRRVFEKNQTLITLKMSIQTEYYVNILKSPP